MIDCELKNPDSKLSWKSMKQYGYAVNLLVLQEQAGLSFFEARVYLSGIRNEKWSKIAEEFGSGQNEEELSKLYWELDERCDAMEDLPFYVYEEYIEFDDCSEKEKF